MVSILDTNGSANKLSDPEDPCCKMTLNGSYFTIIVYHITHDHSQLCNNDQLCFGQITFRFSVSCSSLSPSKLSPDDDNCGDEEKHIGPLKYLGIKMNIIRTNKMW